MGEELQTEILNYRVTIENVLASIKGGIESIVEFLTEQSREISVVNFASQTARKSFTAQNPQTGRCFSKGIERKSLKSKLSSRSSA